jgi:hypothetical protein
MDAGTVSPTTKGRDMTNQTSPHEAEYLAAVEGMQETYGGLHGGHTALVEGQLVTTWNVGERVKFRHKDHGELVGTIIEVLVEEGELSQYHIAAHVPGRGRQHFAVLNRDVLIF